MKLVTSEQMRELDRRTIVEFGTPGEVLMERAGHGVADVVRGIAARAGLRDPQVLHLAGRGNNGGDAFAAARHLKNDGFRVRVWLAGALKDVKDDALRHLHRMAARGIPVRELAETTDWDEVRGCPDRADIVVDGILGVGIRGPARGAAAEAIRFINALGRRARVVAIDVPSGLDADTGEGPGETVRADVTATIALPKRGLIEPRAADYVGALECIDIGVPDAFVDALPGDIDFIAEQEVRDSFRRRERQAHKGTFGHALVLTGAAGFAGAAAMAAKAALRSGTGLVSAVVPRSVAPVVASLAQEVMVHGADETDAGTLSATLWTEWERRIGGFDAVLMGPGMTPHADSLLLVRRALDLVKAPLVLDADALTIFAGDPQALKRTAGPTVITPHPGELARLLGCRSADIQADRLAAARRAADVTGAIVVLKGAGTIVAQAGRPPSVNMTGNPGMATGGTGDILAGMVLGLLAQGMEPMAAARSAVYVHGRAGDNAALRGSEAGLIAGDLIDELPRVWRDLLGR